MALTYNQISGITQNKFIPKLYDNVFLGHPLLERAKRRGWYKKEDGGQKVVIPLEYDDLSASGWYNGAETLDTTDNETMTAAELEWKQLYASISITRKDELKNSGDSQIINFVKAKTKNAEKTMRSQLSTGLWSAGTDAKSIVGLRMWVNTDQTVGGISQSAYSWWQAQLDSTTTTMTMAALQTRFNACSEGDEQPTVGVGTKANYNRLYNLLQPQQRFIDVETAKAGFTSLMFNGIPILADSNAPANYLKFLNENHLHLIAHKDEDMRFEPFAKPINQNVKVAKIYWMGVFGCSNNRYQGGFSGLTA